VIIELAGRRTFLAHGDGLGNGDLGYRLLRMVLRGGLTRWAFRWLHPDVGARIAQRVSATETRSAGPTPDDRARSRALESWARERLAADPSLDLLVLGHTHVPLVREVEPERWYVNSGDWVHHTSYVILEPGRPPELREWREDDRG
jgi:UDP-2,3-diacylglucosamine hydrolase